MLTHLKDKGMLDVSIDNLDKIMTNMGSVQFNYDVLKSAYDQDPKIKELIKDFDQDKIRLKSSEIDDLPNGKKKDPQAVSKMAKRAVDLKDL